MKKPKILKYMQWFLEAENVCKAAENRASFHLLETSSSCQLSCQVC